MLNEYFEFMVDVLFRPSTLDSMIGGTEIRALFGAPVTGPIARRPSSVRCAIEMPARVS